MLPDLFARLHGLERGERENLRLSTYLLTLGSWAETDSGCVVGLTRHSDSLHPASRALFVGDPGIRANIQFDTLNIPFDNKDAA